MEFSVAPPHSSLSLEFQINYTNLHVGFSMFFSLIGKRNISVGGGGIKSTVDHLLPARKRSFDMAMFSQVFVCPWAAGGGPLASQHASQVTCPASAGSAYEGVGQTPPRN